MPTRRRVPASRALGPVHTSRSQITPDSLLSVALGDAELSLAIPENATLPQVEETMKLAITGHRLLVDAAEKVKPLIGRLLLIVQERTLYKPGFKTFTEYVEQRIVKEFQLSRSSAFDALKIARAFPNMTAKDYTAYGASRLLLAATASINEKVPNYREVLDKASRMPVDAFKDQLKLAQATSNSGPDQATEATHVTISIQASPECRARWQALLNASGILAADLLNRMMDREIAATASLASILTPTAGASRH